MLLKRVFIRLTKRPAKKPTFRSTHTTLRWGSRFCDSASHVSRSHVVVGSRYLGRLGVWDLQVLMKQRYRFCASSIEVNWVKLV